LACFQGVAYNKEKKKSITITSFKANFSWQKYFLLEESEG
jgi:hypothetical protein